MKETALSNEGCFFHGFFSGSYKFLESMPTRLAINIEYKDEGLTL